VQTTRWWTRSIPIRTVAQLPLVFAVTETRHPFNYQQIAETASVLRRLGMSASSIAQRLGVSDKTVAKALRRSGDAGVNGRR
jgi:transposase-like protein